MPDYRLNIHTMDGLTQMTEAPDDMSAADFLKELTEGLNLTARDAEGRPVSWKIVDKDIGAELDPDRTLKDNGVRDDHHLYLHRHLIAG